VVHKFSHTQRCCYFNGAVSGTVVDDQELDRIDPGDRAWHEREHEGERGLFVEARHLHYEFHGALASRRAWTRPGQLGPGKDWQLTSGTLVGFTVVLK
jgi:hypothetical protein